MGCEEAKILLICEYRLVMGDVFGSFVISG